MTLNHKSQNEAETKPSILLINTSFLEAGIPGYFTTLYFPFSGLFIMNIDIYGAVVFVS